MRFTLALLAASLVVAAGCTRQHESSQPSVLSSEDSLLCVRENVAHRLQVDAAFREDTGSPFHRDSSITYTGIKWFPIDVRFRQKAVLQRLAAPETVTVMGTKGEPRKQLRYGFFDLLLPDEHGTPTAVRLYVYKFTPSDSTRYARFPNHLSVWFTDLTTDKETYHVGRYIELGEEHAHADEAYTIDLNTAFNPYCAYSALYSCAIPTDKDRVPIALRVGEMKYHD